MDERSQQRFNEITAKDVSSLTEADKIFLRARRDYLKPHQREEYKELLEAEPAIVQPTFTYRELLVRAKELGYRGPRLRREQLEEYIAEHNNNPFKE